MSASKSTGMGATDPVPGACRASGVEGTAADVGGGAGGRVDMEGLLRIASAAPRCADRQHALARFPFSPSFP
jgi:hypothetical protein